MPYKSKAQQRFFHYLESKGKMPKKTVDEFDESTDYKDIPEMVPHYANGGMIDHMQEGERRAPHDNEDMPTYDGMGGHIQEGVMEAPRYYQRSQKMAYGGMVGNAMDNYDYKMGNAEEYDSAGEPHTEDELEDKHPMEYMSKVGRIKMAKGGMVSRKFAQALRRYR